MTNSGTVLPDFSLPVSKSYTVQLRVRGVVQGVGFRPFIYRLALERSLKGWVLNDAEGVLIQISGNEPGISSFQKAIACQAPAAARVESIAELSRQEGLTGETFEIAKSQISTVISTLISPDLTLCDDCLRELFDPADKRYLYPFINCTNCGPRYSIIEALPYDRPTTTMQAFDMCAFCNSEYHDPRNRRFHAQPLACPECGPVLHYLDAKGLELARAEEVIPLAAKALSNGNILAIKGLGGYHLACDARNAQALNQLRERKYRKEKPFALMAKDLAELGNYVVLDEASCELLRSNAHPIVLLPKGKEPLPEALAPDNAELGLMLPYTPLQHLLFAAGAPGLLVMTSANRSSEPIAYQDEEAIARLSGIADAFITGERPIARRVDDSVTTVFDDKPALLRRARGYAPAPVLQHERLSKPILALGAGLKNSITLATGGYAFMSQHLGDLDNYDAYLAFTETIQDLCQMYQVNLADALIVHDLHPDYGSSRYAKELPGTKFAVQHHQAHIASVLAEHDSWDEAVLGFSFDGTGLGSDQTLWGGEVLYGSLGSGFKRVGHLMQAHLPGGDAAARNPQQAAVGFLFGLEPTLWTHYLDQRGTGLVLEMIEKGFNSPKTSSMGRLFDAVAAVCGFGRKMSFEGQAAIWLECLARRDILKDRRYPLPFDGQVFNYIPLLEAILVDKRNGLSAESIAYGFHAALAEAVVIAAQKLKERYAFKTVCLSGGVWQNKLLHQLSLKGLRDASFEVWWNSKVPAGDGGISLGQVALAAGQFGHPGSTAIKEAGNVFRHSLQSA